MLRFVKRWPFLTLGLITFVLFMAVELPASTSGGCYSSASVSVSADGTVISHQESSTCEGNFLAKLTTLISPLVIPIWLMRDVEMIIGISFLPWPLQIIIAVPLLFLPYVAADLLLRLAIGTRSPMVS
jgi:hypothetical protein